MGLRLTTLLLIANIVVFFIIVRVHDTDSQGKEDNGYQMLIGSRNLDVNRLEIHALKVGTSTYEPTMVLSKNRNRWTIEKPIRWPANFHAVNAIINQIKYLQKDVSFSVSEVLETGQTLADYGLEQPNMIIKLSLNEQEMTLKVGSPTELDNKFYLLGPEGEHIYVVGVSLLTSLKVSIDEVRDPEIFDIPAYEIDSLQMDAREGGNLSKVRIEREADNWRIQTPIQANADNDKVEMMLQQLLMTRVNEFIDTRANANGIFQSTHELLLEGNQRRQKLSLGYLASKEEGIEPKLAARLDDWDLLFSLDKKILTLLQNAQEQLRDKTLTPLNPADVHSLDIENYTIGTKLSLRKQENGDWQVIRNKVDGGMESIAAEESVVRELLQELSKVNVEKFVTDAPSNEDLKNFGFESPQLAISYNDGSAKRIVFGNSLLSENQVYVRIMDKPSVFSMDDYLYRKLEKEYLHYRNRVIDQLATGAEILSIQIKDLKEETVVLNKFIKGKPAEDSIPETVLSLDQQNALESLLKELRSFRVENITSDKLEKEFIGQYGNRSPWRFELTALIKLPGGIENSQTVTKQYYFTRRLGGSLQGGGNVEKDLTFELSQSTIDHLYKLVFERKLPEEYRPPVVEQNNPVQ